MSTSAFIADWGLHVGIGGMAACTNGCVRHFCKHKLKQYAIAGTLIVGEGALTVWLVG